MRSVFLIIACCCAAWGYAQTAEVRTYGGLYFDEGRDICQWDGGYAMVGTTASVDDDNSDVLLMKLHDDLSIAWTRTLGNVNSEQGRSVVALPGGDVLVYGQTANGVHGGYDLLLFRVNNAGEVLWRKEYGSADWDLANRVVFGNNTVFISATTYGSTPGDSRMMILRLDQDGEVLDESTYDILPEAEAHDLFFYEGYNYLAGTRTYEGQSSQAVIRKLLPSGAVVWEQVRDSVAFLGNAVHVSAFGIAAGYTFADQTEEGNWDLLLTGFNFNGDEVWSRWDNPPDAGVEICRDILWYDSNTILTTALSGIYGSGGDGAKVLRNDAGGFFAGATVFGGEADEEPFRMLKDSEGRVVIVGRSDSFSNGNDDVYLVRIPDAQISNEYVIEFADFSTGGVFVGVEEKRELQPLVGPNPATEMVYLPALAEWQLWSAGGQLLAEGFSRNVNVASQPAGIYILRWKYRGNWLHQRIVKQ